MTAALAEANVLVVGVGGLGCPAARILVRSGVGRLTLADDDVVDESNLHRQTLFEAGDIGRSKAVLGAERLQAEAASLGLRCEVRAHEQRVMPEDARAIVKAYDLVLEGADNFATKFLIADACALAGIPVVQAGAVRWVGWALACRPAQSACLRCVFEDVPEQRDTCASAGVVGPVVGVLAALQAALALRLLRGDASAAGTLYSYEGLSGQLRQRQLLARPGCALCTGQITDTAIDRYVPAEANP